MLDGKGPLTRINAVVCNVLVKTAFRRVLKVELQSNYGYLDLIEEITEAIIQYILYTYIYCSLKYCAFGDEWSITIITGI